MLKQYFKLIFRNLLQRKSFSIINIFGIALGFAVSILTLLYVFTEYKFDRHIPGVANKYRIIWRPSDDRNAILPYVFRGKLESQLPEKTQICLVNSIGKQYLSHNKEDYSFESILSSDSGFKSMFGLSILQGDTANLLNAPLQVLLSEQAAEKIFGDENPVTQTVQLWMQDFIITGVFKDLPPTSFQKADAIISASSWKTLSPGNLTSWGNKSYDYFLSLPSNTNIIELQKKIKDLYLNSDPGFGGITDDIRSMISFELEPITDIHLKSDHVLWDDDKNKGNLSMVKAFICIGMLILLMAGFNYINLSSAYFQTKNTFSGMQKLLGANIRNLAGYIFLQTFVVVTIGFVLSLLSVKLVLPFFNHIVSRHISFSFLFSPAIGGILFIVILFMIIFAGFSPAVSFARGNPVFTLNMDFHGINAT